LKGAVQADIDAAERRLERLATLLDSAFVIPGTGIRFGADPLLGLVPGAGDLVALGLSGYMLLEAHRLEAPASLLTRMAANIALDAAVGSIPLLGDLFDVAFKANRRNMRLLREHFADLRSRHARDVTPRRP
jgi:hypothetical protein